MCFPRHFLFKPGGTSPMYCTTSPGYPLTSSTVYSPPPRPLPRNTFSRPAFSLKKPYKHCNWKCAALSAILISLTLLLLLAYFIGESPVTLVCTEIYASANLPPSPAPHLKADRDESMLYCAPAVLHLNSVESVLCTLYKQLYRDSYCRLTPCPHTPSEETLSFIDWTDWICR